jgi:hypothetical protein
VISRLSAFDGRRLLSPSWRLEDALIDGYVDWRETRASVQTTYEWWDDASKDEREAAFVAYLTALEQEERAGETYAELLHRVADAASGSG